MAARLDANLASTEQWVNAIAALFDEKLNRASEEKITVVVDVRGGEGWANPSAPSLLSLVRGASTLLSDNFPERLQRLIIVPLPWIAVAVWSLAKAFLDPVTADKVVVINGAADRLAPLPEETGTHLHAEALAVLHALRRAAFVPPSL